MGGVPGRHAAKGGDQPEGVKDPPAVPEEGEHEGVHSAGQPNDEDPMGHGFSMDGDDDDDNMFAAVRLPRIVAHVASPSAKSDKSADSGRRRIMHKRGFVTVPEIDLDEDSPKKAKVADANGIEAELGAMADLEKAAEAAIAGGESMPSCAVAAFLRPDDVDKSD